jgi:hypothetical protein
MASFDLMQDKDYKTPAKLALRLSSRIYVPKHTIMAIWTLPLLFASVALAHTGVKSILIDGQV